MLNDAGRVCGHCFRGPDIASWTCYGAIPCRFCLYSKKKSQRAETKHESIAPKRPAGV